ncbi:MAG: RES domain-containing protein [Armatimonadota bacterium]|nr:RES domain-containing protein [Armatimonadota bacterium]
MIVSSAVLTKVCGRLATTAENKTWFRAVEPQFWKAALGTSHTRTATSRFSAGSATRPLFETLYLAENPLVSLLEVQAIFGDPTTPGSIVPHPQKAFIVLNVEIRLSRVADLTSVSTQRALHTTAQELTGDWVGYG